MDFKEVELFISRPYRACALALTVVGGLCLFGCNAEKQEPLSKQQMVSTPPSSSSIDTVAVDTLSVDSTVFDSSAVDSVVMDSSKSVSKAPMDDVNSASEKPAEEKLSSSSERKVEIKDKVTDADTAAVDSLVQDSVVQEPAVCSDVKPSELCDARDNKRYLKVRIGKQTWMAQNLDYETEGSWCFENRPENCVKFGRLYQWNASVCPEGWHLPSMDEMTQLHDFAKSRASESNRGVGTVLKSTTMWDEDEDDNTSRGLDLIGFEARPAGYRRADGRFMSLGAEANFWVNREDSDPTRASYWNLYYANEDFIGSYVSVKDAAFSVRCLKN